MRKAHFLKRSHATNYPRHAVWIDTETDQINIDDKTVKHKLNFGWSCYRRRSRGHKWSREEWFRFTSINQFWEYLTNHISNKETYYIFAHNWTFDFTVLDGFTWLFDNGWELKSAVVDGPPVILTYRKEGKTLKFIDTLNIWRMSLSQLGESIGINKLVMPDNWENNQQSDLYCQTDVTIIMQACLNWFMFLHEHDFGGFAATLASQAFKTYRYRFMQHEIFMDDNEKALEMARESYHGGRTECFYIGQITETLYQLDINSMYPDVMATSEMPTQLIGVYKSIHHLECIKLLNRYTAIANVNVSVDEPVFSQFDGKRLIFPVGEFQTVLATPELKYAFEHGYITHIERIAFYDKAVIFKKYVDYIYDLRMHAKERGDDAAAFYLKIMLNSLYGKFGQRGRVYESWDTADDTSIRSWSDIDADTGETHKFRQFGGLIQKQVDECESTESHPAIAAHVTAYARMKLWHLYKIADIKNVYYSDTDCVLVNQTGYERLEHLIDDKRLGMLKLERIVKSGEIRGAKDYTFNGETKIKGIRGNALWLSDNKVIQDKWIGLRGMIANGEMSAPITMKQEKNLSREYKKGVILSTGRITPFRKR